RGQAIVLIAIAMIALIAITALAVDTGQAYLNRRSAQSAADAAALAAALAKVKNQDWQTVALARAATNGFQNDGNTQVIVNFPPGVSCNGQASPYTGDNEYVQVLIRTTVPTSFGVVVGIEEVNNCVEAIARARPATDGALFNGMAVVTTHPTGQSSFLLNGGAHLRVRQSGIFVNSSHPHGLFLNGNSSIVMDTYGQTVSGTYGKNGNASVTPGIVQGTQIDFNASTFSFVPPIPSPPTCSTPGSQSGTNPITFTPGYFNNIAINANQTAIFQPGVYCINGNLNVNGNATITSSDRVIFVTQNQSIIFNGGITISIPDIEIYTVNGQWIFNGSNTFTPNRIRFYASGSGKWIVNGGSTISANDAFFYLTGGYIVWNGNSNINLHAPTAPDPFAGILVYMPWGNTSPAIFNGGSNIYITGSYLAPSSPM
ncbi:MAG: pilus assembly protein TadG-related protein, partial [Anaerolineales bacterium]